LLQIGNERNSYVQRRNVTTASTARAPPPPLIISPPGLATIRSSFDFNENDYPTLNIGSLFNSSSRCLYCQAYKFPNELLSCCLNGQAHRLWSNHVPQQFPINSILHKYTFSVGLNEEETRKAKSYRDNIVNFNNGLAMSSVCTNVIRQTGFNPSVIWGSRLVNTQQGNFHAPPQHLIGQVDVNATPRYAGFWIHDQNAELAAQRVNAMMGQHGGNGITNDQELTQYQGTMQQLQSFLSQNNVLAQQFQYIS
jgi:hypothetical protein